MTVAAGANPAEAAADITASSISSPADGSALFYNGDNGSGSVEVVGTVTGAGAGTHADLVCYDRSDSETFKLLSAADVSSGSFAATVSLKPVAGRACRLRLVPTAASPPTGSAATPFTGPAISVSDLFSHSGNGNLWGYDILSGTLQTAYELQSLGECPVLASFITDPASLGSFELFAGNACLPASSGIAPNLGGRSSLQVDGTNAYLAGAISKLSGTAGFLPINFAPTFTTNHDEVTIDESDTPMVCGPPATFPPTSATCPQLQAAGLQIASTTTLLDGGSVARVDQTLKNTDTRPHTVDLLFGQSVTAPSSSQVPGFEFPGQQTLAGHQQPDSFTQFAPGPGSIVAISDSSSGPSPSNPIGAITYNRPPADADFVSSSASQVATFVMHYHDTLQPSATAAYDWSFSQATSADGLASLEQVERDRFSMPLVAITHPRNHASTRHRKIPVTGTVSDPVGVSSLTVNGKRVTVVDGAFSTFVRLTPGKNVIAAEVANEAGNTGIASVEVTYKQPLCVVPKLRGRTLAAARRALQRHDCRAGRVVTVSSKKVHKGRIVGTRPAAGSKHKPFSKVRLYVSRGRPRGGHDAAVLPGF